MLNKEMPKDEETVKETKDASAVEGEASDAAERKRHDKGIEMALKFAANGNNFGKFCDSVGEEIWQIIERVSRMKRVPHPEARTGYYTHCFYGGIQKLGAKPEDVDYWEKVSDVYDEVVKQAMDQF